MAYTKETLATMSGITNHSSFLHLRILGFCTQQVTSIYLHFTHVSQPSVSQKSFYNVQLHPRKKILTIKLNALKGFLWKNEMDY